MINLLRRVDDGSLFYGFLVPFEVRNNFDKVSIFNFLKSLKIVQAT